jgi:uncharacterized protein (TIGR00251 family)
MNLRAPAHRAQDKALTTAPAAGLAQPASPDFLQHTPHGTLLAVKLQPRASKNEIQAAQGGELRIRVTAPPVDAAANEALLRLLAEALELPRRSVELVRGHTSRHKTLRLHGLSVAEARERLAVGCD